MGEFRIESVSPPFDDPRGGALAARIVAFANTIGLLANRPIHALNPATWARVLAGYRKSGLLSAPAAGDFAEGLARIYAAIEESPIPDSEWKPMRAALGDELLGRLLQISPVSLRRYSSAERATPQRVAERLHVIALIVSDLAGSYNGFGIRRWFERKRAQLDGKAPSALLVRDWTPDDPAVRRVRELAASVTGIGAT